MEFATELADFIQAFEPEPLDDKTLGAFYYEGTMPIRMNDDYVSPLDNIYRACVRPQTHNAHLLLGHRGCGKSTELNLLKQRLEADGRRVSVIQCGMEANLSGMTYCDLLVLMGRHLCEIAAEAGCELSDELLADIEDFWKDCEITKTTIKSGEVKTSAGISVHTPNFVKIISFFTNLSGELRYGQDQKEMIRDIVKKDSNRWIGYMEEVSFRISECLGGKQPVLIFEDLDKLSFEKVWGVFNAPLAEMPFPIIYTVPISFSYDPRFAGVAASFHNHDIILPMIKIRTIDGEPYDRGTDALCEIVKKRANPALFDDGVLKFLTEKTGGVLRDLFQCIMEAANRAQNREAATINMEDALHATSQLRSRLTRMIETKNYSMLVNINQGKKRKSDIEDKAMLLEMMLGTIVLEYNGERWHDLHPLVEDFLRKQGELS